MGKQTCNSLVFVRKVKAFLDDEARSCSMDYGSVTPIYVYRMWGGVVALDEISKALESIKDNNWL